MTVLECLAVRGCAATYENPRTGAVVRRKSSFILMEYVPVTLKAALEKFPRGTVVPFPWVVQVLVGVRTWAVASRNSRTFCKHTHSHTRTLTHPHTPSHTLVQHTCPPWSSHVHHTLS